LLTGSPTDRKGETIIYSKDHNIYADSIDRLKVQIFCASNILAKTHDYLKTTQSVPGRPAAILQQQNLYATFGPASYFGSQINK
jgi:hypothetical protein